MEQNEFYQVFRGLRETHRQVIHERFRAIGLSRGQPKVIEYLFSHDGCIQKELADNCQVKASTVTNILATMENQKLIIRCSSDQDRRVLRVFLTPLGFEMAKKIREVNRDVDKLALASLSQSEQEAVLGLMEKITANLKERGKHDGQPD